MENQSKKCIKCGVSLTLDHFRRTPLSPDGYAKTCKQCVHKRLTDKDGGRNPDLIGFTPRQLIEELRVRGYTGTLTITKEIKL